MHMMKHTITEHDCGDVENNKEVKSLFSEGNRENFNLPLYRIAVGSLGVL